MVMVAILIGLSVGLAHGFQLEPPENRWISQGLPVDLKCRATTQIRTCSWTTPYGKVYPLQKGLNAESGRLEFFALDDMDCGIRVRSVEQQDAGKWSCNVGIVNDQDEIITAEGFSTLNIAMKPELVSLMAPYDNGVANVSMKEGLEQPIQCQVHHTRPRPQFSWFIGDMKLDQAKIENEEDEEDSSYTQTLFYRPDLEHDNQDLKCVVSHITLHQDEVKEARVTLNFIDSPEDMSRELRKSLGDAMQEEEEVQDMMMYASIGTGTALMLLITALVLTASAKQILCFKKPPSASASSQDDPDGQEKQDDQPEKTLKTTLKGLFQSKSSTDLESAAGAPDTAENGGPALKAATEAEEQLLQPDAVHEPKSGFWMQVMTALGLRKAKYPDAVGLKEVVSSGDAAQSEDEVKPQEFEPEDKEVLNFTEATMAKSEEEEEEEDAPVLSGSSVHTPV